MSRDMAKSVLTELVASLDLLERVETISDIFINPNFDSVLEARFIESLKRLGGVGGIPMVKLVQDIVNGKSGYLLEVGKQRYRVEPQCEVWTDHGAAFPSKPDFVIWPWATTSKRKPIAVFCDGWAYHKDSLREDAQKRSAIVAGGRMWVWSVTHNDVMSALAGSLDSDLDSPLVAMSRHSGSSALPTVPRAQEKAFTQHQVARLLQWLATGVDEQGQDAGLEQLRRNALWLGFLMIPSTPEDNAICAHQMGQWLPRLPDAIREPGKGFAPCASKPNGVCSQTGWWPLVMAKGQIPLEGWAAPGVVVLDASASESESEVHLAWRRWLQVFNAVQCLPGMLLVTANGLDAHDYDALVVDTSTPASAPAQAADQAALHHAWTEVLGGVLADLRPGLTVLANAGVPIPEVGLELADEKGCVLADAEIAWTHAKVAVLRPDQEDMTQTWQEAGWKVVLLDESHTLVSGQPWPLATAPLLGLELKNEE